MRLLEDEPDRLVIELRPTGLLILCLGMFLLFFFLGFGMNTVLPAVVGLLGFPGEAALGNLPQIPGMTVLGLASFLPLGLALVFLRTRRLEFDRTAATVVIHSHGMTGRKVITYPLSTVQGAVLITNRAQDGRVAHRAALKLAGAKGIVPLTPYFTSGSGPELTVNAINAWLAPSRP